MVIITMKIDVGTQMIMIIDIHMFMRREVTIITIIIITTNKQRNLKLKLVINMDTRMVILITSLSNQIL